MKRAAAGLLIASVVSLAPHEADACAGCSNPNLPVAQVQQQGAPAAGTWGYAVTLSGTALRVVHETGCPDLGPSCRLYDPGPYLHDQGLRLAELRAQVDYAINGFVGLQLQFPWRVVDTDITYRRLDGTAFVPDEEGIHHRDETLAGPGDPWLLVRFTGVGMGFTWSGRVGASIPLGRTEPDPFLAGREGQPHQHLQFGTGTFTPVLAGETSRRIGDAFLHVYLLAQPMLVENTHGFRAGHRVGGGLGAAWSFGGTRAGLSVDVIHEEAERWRGVVQQDGNLGRTDLLAGLSVTFAIPGHDVTLGVRTPVWQRVIGGQVSYPAIGSLTIARTATTP